MIYSAVTSWRPQLFLLAGRRPAPVCAMPPVQSAAVNNPLGKKPSTAQKWLRGERWNVSRACHATVLGVFHKSNVVLLLLLCHSCTHHQTLVSFPAALLLKLLKEIVLSLRRRTTVNLKPCFLKLFYLFSICKDHFNTDVEKNSAEHEAQQ